MKDTIAESIAKFDSSVPIYKGEVKHDGDSIEFSLKSTYRPVPASYTDYIDRLVAEHYSESFDPATNSRPARFEVCINTRYVYEAVTTHVIEVYEHFCPLKNPKQSRQYKWLRSIDGQYNHPAREAFVALYRYSRENQLLILPTSKVEAHGNNFLAVLDLLKDKHENK